MTTEPTPPASVYDIEKHFEKIAPDQSGGFLKPKDTSAMTTDEKMVHDLLLHYHHAERRASSRDARLSRLDGLWEEVDRPGAGDERQGCVAGIRGSEPIRPDADYLPELHLRVHYQNFRRAMNDHEPITGKELEGMKRRCKNASLAKVLVAVHGRLSGATARRGRRSRHRGPSTAGRCISRMKMMPISSSMPGPNLPRCIAEIERLQRELSRPGAG